MYELNTSYIFDFLESYLLLKLQAFTKKITIFLVAELTTFFFNVIFWWQNFLSRTSSDYYSYNFWKKEEFIQFPASHHTWFNPMFSLCERWNSRTWKLNLSLSWLVVLDEGWVEILKYVMQLVILTFFLPEEVTITNDVRLGWRFSYIAGLSLNV